MELVVDEGGEGGEGGKGAGGLVGEEPGLVT